MGVDSRFHGSMSVFHERLEATSDISIEKTVSMEAVKASMGMVAESPAGAFLETYSYFRWNINLQKNRN